MARREGAPGGEKRVARLEGAPGEENRVARQEGAPGGEKIAARRKGTYVGSLLAWGLVRNYNHGNISNCAHCLPLPPELYGNLAKEKLNYNVFFNFCY